MSHPNPDLQPEDAPVVIRIDDVSKRFTLRKDKSLKDRLLAFRAGRKNREVFVALDGVSAEIRAGHTVALIGHNGSGKSTLLKLIGGILDPSSGTISRRGRVAALLELGAGFHPDLSGRDNVYLNASLLGMSRAETEAVFDSIVTFAELEDFIDTQVKFYSSGMYVRLAFAVAVHTDPDILLVDEVLAVGDEAFQRKCMDVIRRFQHEGRTILLVTHNLGQVLELADSAVLLHQGKLVFDGEPREAVQQFRELLEERRIEHESTHGTSEEETERPQLAATATASGPRPGEPLEPGEPLTITIDLEGELVSDDWVCVVRVENTHGQGVIDTTTQRLGLKTTSISGKRTVEFTFTDPRFGKGQYFVNFAIRDSSGVHVADVPQACTFYAETPKGVEGMMYSPAVVTQS